MEKKDFIQWARKLQQGYQASEQTKQQLAQVDLLAIVGPTGVGKSTIIKELGLPYVMSDVSRTAREDEKNHQNYHFREDYLDIIKEIKNGDYAQFLVSKYDEFYGTRASSYPKEGPCTMAIVASAMSVFRNLGFRNVLAIYVMPPSYVEWMRRIGGARTTDLLGRIDEARQSINLALEEQDQYRFVLNDELSKAVDDIKKLMNGENVDEHRSQLAIDTADIILERIGDEEVM